MSGRWRGKVVSLARWLQAGVLLGSSFATTALAQPERAVDVPQVGSDESSEPAYQPARASLEILGPNPAYVGQLVEVEVELFRDAAEPDKRAPFFPELELDGAIALLSKSAPPPENRRFDGGSFLGQKRRYLVFPQVDGVVHIPPVKVEIPQNDGKWLVVETPSAKLRADIPRGVKEQLPLIADSVHLERTIEGDLAHLRVGEPFTVSLTLTASHTDPVMLPGLELPELDGTTRYLAEPLIRAQTDRGSYLAIRTDRATYIARAWGKGELPAVRVLWLDPSSGQYAEATAPAVTFRTRLNPSLGLGCAGPPVVLARLGAGAGLFLFVALLGVRLCRRVLRERRGRALVRRSSGERAAFEELRVSARSGRDGATLTALYRWMHEALRGMQTLTQLRASVREDELSEATCSLEGRVARATGSGHAEDVLAPISALRKAQRQRAAQGEELPNLN